jgi:peptide/nickel transport system permease protein
MQGEPTTLRQRIGENPRPAIIWVAGFLALFALEAGAFLHGILVLTERVLILIPFTDIGLQAVISAKETAGQIPTLLSRDLIPNAGHLTPDGRWVGTFPENLPYFDSGLEPKWAWFIRNALAFGYAAALLGWTIRGYQLFKREYREADWTPQDDAVRRFRRHSWGKAGFIVVFLFVTMAVFAPTLGPTTVDQNIIEPYSYEFDYYNEETGQVETIIVGTANGNSRSNGGGAENVGPWQYDDYNRFHPFGTLPQGTDLYTFMASGARVSLFIGLLAILISGTLAAVFAMVSAYYKGVADLVLVVAGDSIMSIPQLLLLILLSAVFAGHWLGEIYSGGFLLALIFGFSTWPFLWRAIRGPALQVSTEEWVDAARSYGQTPRKTMTKHMLPYVIGYLMVYASLFIGGIIITTSALSFLGGGLGVNSPTPEWGRAIAAGQDYVATQSWHVALIPGVLIVLVVTGFNAFGDGIRDSIDPESEGGEGETDVVAGGAG